VKRLLALYPRWWTERYGDEMRSLLLDAPRRRRDGLDLARGALDAWLHPPVPSHLAGIAALVGGAAWTAVALAVVLQPVPPDWPGYLHESLPLAVLAAGSLLIATLGVAVRAADPGGRAAILAAWIAAAGYVVWMCALIGTAAGVADGVTLAVGHTLAMFGTIAVGITVFRVGQDVVGLLLVVAATSMLIPVTPAWLVFGACWTVIGVVLEFDRTSRTGRGLGAA
jgi:hypothetical protein